MDNIGSNASKGCDRRCIRAVLVLLPLSLLVSFFYLVAKKDEFNVLPTGSNTLVKDMRLTDPLHHLLINSSHLHAAQLRGLQSPIPVNHKSVNKSAWNDVLAAFCSSDRVIILALVDSAFMDMALNFYETSLKRFGIENYLFVASDRTACELMVAMNIHCYVYMGDASAEKATVWGSKDFKRKMNIRTYMILDALELGYHILHTDIDIVFLKNPMVDIKCGSACDMAVLWDDSAYNAGFLLTRATKSSIEVYKKSKQTALTTSLDDQAALNGAIAHVKSKMKISITKLDVKKYVCGLYYWENAKRYFADIGPGACTECVVVHNNWMVSREAKTYRFKETHLWMYDGKGYYSDPSRKYIQIDNPAIFKSKDDILKAEKDALVSALAIATILNRTLVLPKLHAGTAKDSLRPLNSFFKITKFDANFGDIYRESSFLSHSKVPEAVRKSVSTPYVIESDTFSRLFPDSTAISGLKKLQPKDKSKGATSEEIKLWFAEETASVINFHSLYGAFSHFTSDSVQQSFANKLKEGLVPGAYRQY